MNAPRILKALWMAGGLALLLGFAREFVLSSFPRAKLLKRSDTPENAVWFTGEFRTGAAYPTTTAGLLPAKIATIGSWVDNDEWQGRSETAWFEANRRTISVGVAGYPQNAGCKLWAEFRGRDGATTRIDCPLINPREQWNIWEIRRPSGTTAVRIVGEDRSSANAGWFAFSHPFTAWPGVVTAAYLHAQLYTTTALALVLIWGPGLLWRPHNSSSAGVSPAPDAGEDARATRSAATSGLRPIIFLGAGPLMLATAGVVIWCLSGWIRPQTVGLALVAILWVALGVSAWRRGFALNVNWPLGRLLAVSALVVVAVVAKSAYSVGPQGELFRGTISRNMEMADRIDSRYSFYVVQAAAYHQSPASPTTEKFFSPWTFFSRGPLAGLTTIPVVMATNGHPPDTLPENRWSPFDRTGFAAYRVTMITLASTAIIALFMMLVSLVGERWALVAGGLLALSPFGVHEMMFTWPKWIATAWLLASFSLAHARRPIGAGLSLGVGFLFHPLALLWAPWIALWAAGRESSAGFQPVSWDRGRPARISAEAGGTPALPRRSRPHEQAAIFATTLLRFGLGAGAVVVPWMLVGALMPHLSTTPLAGQSGFFRYWIHADWKLATWDTWWKTRWMNFANTFVPLHVYLADSSFNHPKLSSAYETSGRLVRFSQVWWNTLPFGMGLGLWALSLVALAKASLGGTWPPQTWDRGRPARIKESSAGVAPAPIPEQAGRLRYFQAGGTPAVPGSISNTLRAAALLFIAAPALLITAYWGMDPLGLMRECGHPLFIAAIAITCIVAARRDGWLRTILLHRAVPWLQLPETWLMLWLTTLANPAPWAVEFDQLDWLCLTINSVALAAAAGMLSRPVHDYECEASHHAAVQ